MIARCTSAALCLVLVLGYEPGSGIVHSIQSPQIQNLPDFNLIVRRAYAIHRLFERVYSNGWEGANGSIGAAFLYAATKDPALLQEYTQRHKLADLFNGTWVDDRAWICLAELYWWEFTGKKNSVWVKDAMKRYDDARNEGRLAHPDGFWSWYNWPPDARVDDMIITNSNMNQMVNVACRLYGATGKKNYRDDAVMVWEGDSKIPGVEQTYYRGDGRWEGTEGRAAFGKTFPWQGAEYCSIGAAMYRMTKNEKYKKIVVATARRIMDPANGWVDKDDFYQIRMDGNGAFVHFVLDAYEIAPKELAEIPMKVGKMLEHVWTNHHGAATVVLHREMDDGIRNGWNPYGGEDGYGVGEVGTVHAQSQALRAFGVFAYTLRH
ncbi:MAG TPA: hypothetical protein VMM57_03525 [Bacteroidota bacterium]|nr:hypothetical protein [Bacteroidota bacterium]